MAMTFSQGTRSLEMSRFLALSLADNGFFLLRFLACSFWRAPDVRLFLLCQMLYDTIDHVVDCIELGVVLAARPSAGLKAGHGRVGSRTKDVSAIDVIRA